MIRVAFRYLGNQVLEIALLLDRQFDLFRLDVCVILELDRLVLLLDRRARLAFEFG